MSVIWHKVWFDLWHNKIRTLLAVVSIAVGVFAVGATFGMADQISPTMDAAHEASIPAHITLVTDGIDIETATRLKKIRGVAEIDLANVISVRYKIEPHDEWASGELFMRDYEEQSLGLYQLKAGEWPERKRLGIERLSSQYFNLDIGDSVILEIDDKARSLPLTGRVRHPFVNPPEFGGLAVFFGSADVMELFEVPKGEFNQLLVQVAPYSDSFAREIGVMRAIGARTPKMLGMFIFEGILQGLLSWAIAGPLSLIVGQPMSKALGEALFSGGLFYEYNFQAILAWLGVIAAISVLASVLPARNAISISVRESLAYA